MSAVGEFVDERLQYEATWQRAEEHRDRIGDSLDIYGASVGAIRGTVRAALLKFPGLDRDDMTALASELWARPVFERRLAAIVLLQGIVADLIGTDLTRLEGFVRSAGVEALVEPLATDVIRPLVDGLDAASRHRADAVLDRWAAEPDGWLPRAEALVRPPQN